MNRANRIRHRRVFVVLALTLPLALAAAFAARVPPATMAALPGALSEPTLFGDPDRVIPWQGLPLQAELYDRAGALRVVPLEPLRLPNPLLYRASAPPVGDRLPDDARLLGPLSDAAPQIVTLEQPAASGVVLLMSPLTGRVHGWVALGGP